MNDGLIFDPLRGRNVAATPEEKVRQWFIGVLLQSCGVPRPLMNSEVGFKLGAKPYRADILVYSRSGKPLAVVECKRPGVEIGPQTAQQALRYHAVLEVRWIILTNGSLTYVYRRSADGSFQPFPHLPSYPEMLSE